MRLLSTAACTLVVLAGLTVPVRATDAPPELAKASTCAVDPGTELHLAALLPVAAGLDSIAAARTCTDIAGCGASSSFCLGLQEGAPCNNNRGTCVATACSPPLRAVCACMVSAGGVGNEESDAVGKTE